MSRDRSSSATRRQRGQRVVGLVLAEDRLGSGRRARSRTGGRRPPRWSGRRRACRRSRRTRSARPGVPQGHRVLQAGLEHGRRAAVVLRGAQHDDRVRGPLLVAGRPGTRSGTVAAAAATATTRPPMRKRRTRSPDRSRVRPRDTSCTSGPSRTSTGRCGRSGRPDGREALAHGAGRPRPCRRPASRGRCASGRRGGRARPTRRRPAGAAPPGRRRAARGRAGGAALPPGAGAVAGVAAWGGPSWTDPSACVCCSPGWPGRAGWPGPGSGTVPDGEAAASRFTETRKIVVATWRRIRSRSSS